MSVNKVILVGRIGRDIELKYTPSGTAVCNLSLATDEGYTDKNGQKQDRTEWHKVVLWGKTAENVAKYKRKGDEIYVEGKLETREWEKEGQKHYTTEVKAESVTFVGGARSGPSRQDDDEGGFTPF